MKFLQHHTQKTMALRVLSWRDRLRYIVKDIRWFLSTRASRAAAKARIDAICEKHIARLRAEGHIVHETRDGWHVTFMRAPRQERQS